MANKIPIYCTGEQASINSTTVGFLALGDSGYVSVQSTEANCQIACRSAGTYSLLNIYVDANTCTGSSTLVFRKAGGNGNQSVSIPATSTGYFSDGTNSDAVVAGDKVNLQLTAGSGASKTISINSISCIFAPTSGAVKRLVAGNIANTLATGGQTGYIPIAGQLSNNATGTTYSNKIQTAGTLKNLFVYISSNGRATSTTFSSYVTSGPGTLTVSVGANASGVFEDTTHSDAVIIGDSIKYTYVTGSGVGSLVLLAISCEFSSTSNGASIVLNGGNPGSAATSTTYYMPFGGTCALSTAAEASNQSQANAVYIVSQLTLRVSANSITNASTFRFRKNSGNGNQSVSITGSGTGFFTDSTNTDSVVSTDLVNYQLVTGTTGSTGLLIQVVSALLSLPQTTSIAGTSAVSGTLKGAGALAAAVTGHATVSATPKGAGAIAAVITGQAVISSTLRATGKLAAVITGHCAVSAKLTGTVASGITGHATVSGTLKGAGALASVVSGHAVVTALISGSGKLAGSITGHATVSGTLTAKGALVSAITGHASVTALLKGAGALASAITGHAVVSLQAPGALAASVSGHAVVSGTLRGIASLVAHILGQCVVTLRSGTPPSSSTATIVVGPNVPVGKYTISIHGTVNGVDLGDTKIHLVVV